MLGCRNGAAQWNHTTEAERYIYTEDECALLDAVQILGGGSEAFHSLVTKMEDERLFGLTARGALSIRTAT